MSAGVVSIMFDSVMTLALLSVGGIMWIYAYDLDPPIPN